MPDAPGTEVVEITIQYINPPKPGMKFPKGSIKSSEGIYYGVWPNMLSAFKVGEVCSIEFKTSIDGLYKTVTKKIGSSKPAPLAPPPRPRTHPTDQENIFVTALLGHFIEAGKVDLNEDMIQEAADMIQRAFRKCSLGGMQKQTRDDMDDSTRILRKTKWQ